MYVETKLKAVNTIAELRKWDVPELAPVSQPELIQMVSSARAKRAKVVTELKRKIQILQTKIEAFVISEYLTESLELETLCVEIEHLWKITKEMSKKIRTIDPASRVRPT